MLVAEDLKADLGIYLGLGSTLDDGRARLVLDLTLQRVAGVVSPIPDEARPIVLDVAGRAYLNPQATETETVGPFGRTFRAPGVWLTERERTDLRGLVGPRGAFTINPIHPRPDRGVYGDAYPDRRFL